VGTQEKPRLYSEAWDVLRDMSRIRRDPIQAVPVANAIERRYRRIPTYELSDVFAALDQLAEDGLVTKIEVSRYLAYQMTEEGMEAEL
jgi:Fe2+ or Zn2+ uptake regulation protein